MNAMQDLASFVESVMRDLLIPAEILLSKDIAVWCRVMPARLSTVACTLTHLPTGIGVTFYIQNDDVTPNICKRHNYAMMDLLDRVKAKRGSREYSLR